jgi:hypothetical protein
MVHDLRYNWILPELMHKGGNLRVEYKTFYGAAPVSDATDIDAVYDCGCARDSAGSGLFVARGGFGGNVVVDYAVTICLREGESGQDKIQEPMQDRR